MKKINFYTIHFPLWLFFVFCSVAFNGDASRSQYVIPLSAYTITSTDLDLDGEIDLVSGHIYNWQSHWSGIAILQNISNGQFNLTDSLFFFGGQTTLMCGQLDEVENPEIIFREWITQQLIGVLYNNNLADTFFIPVNSINPINWMDIGDVDGNGLNDLVFCSNHGRYWGVIYNHGYKNFTFSPFYSIPDYPPLGIACGDLNGDGKDDIAICGQFIEVYYSTSTGFQKEVLTQAGFKEGIEIKDFDLDGDNDLITSGMATRVVIYENSGDTALIELPPIIFPAYYSDMLVADLNNDTLPDLALLTSYIGDTLSGIHILYNEGNFNTSGPYFLKIANIGETQRKFTSADLDGNGYGDFAIIRVHGLPMQNLLLLFNDGYGNFDPDPFVGLVQMPESKEVLQSFPNPFNDYTTFQYYTDKPARVELVVYSLNGQLISILTNQMQNAGLHFVTWNTQNRKYGTCIACLKVNGKVYKTLKIIIL